MGNLLGAASRQPQIQAACGSWYRDCNSLGTAHLLWVGTASSRERGTDFSTPAGVQHVSEWGEEESSSLWLRAKPTESHAEALWYLGESAFCKIKLQIKNTLTGWERVGRNKGIGFTFQ